MAIYIIYTLQEINISPWCLAYLKMIMVFLFPRWGYVHFLEGIYIYIPHHEVTKINRSIYRIFFGSSKAPIEPFSPRRTSGNPDLAIWRDGSPGWREQQSAPRKKTSPLQQKTCETKITRLKNSEVFSSPTKFRNSWAELRVGWLSKMGRYVTVRPFCL